ncbi:MAG TPA: cellulase family glycosylhydrolase [Candidatus Acidoferrales bacterium]|nr:cellulase family glycosylhydrolase [Candidatus Acidoferrales bacterium]
MKSGRVCCQLIGTIALLLLFGCGDDGEPASPTNQLPALQALHATRGAAPGIFDASGRQVLLRGVNLNSLGDYFQGNPDLPQVIPLMSDDFPTMARYGLNVVRLILNWSLLEPQPGQISTDYLRRIHAAVDAAKAQSIYTVLDMHQDAWGKFIASPPGTTCTAGREPAIGWDGAPEWATITGGASTCRSAGVRELSPAVVAAFSNFYSDHDGIQTSLINAWAALAGEFAREPAVAGYDLLNEPHFGASIATAPPLLGAYSGRVIAAIRAAERAAGGRGHIAFFEPVILWPLVNAAFAPAFTDDDNIVFAPHNYGESLNTLSLEQGFTQAAQDSSTYQTTFWIGEFGWFSDPPANKEKLIRFAQQEDQYLVGGAWWQWKQACGDPHSIGSIGGTPAAQIIQFRLEACPGDVNLGPIPEWTSVLSRPFPRAAPGRLLALVSDGDTAQLRLSGATDEPGQLDLWVPERGNGAPIVQGEGLGTVQTIPVSGGYRLLIPVKGQYELISTQP